MVLGNLEEATVEQLPSDSLLNYEHLSLIAYTAAFTFTERAFALQKTRAINRPLIAMASNKLLAGTIFIILAAQSGQAALGPSVIAVGGCYCCMFLGEANKYSHTAAT